MAGFGRTRRCSHVKVTGHRCGSPALHGEELCYFHARLIQRVSTRLDRAISSIALLENEEAIQVSIMTVIDAILKGTIELKRATLILRAISIAERNSRRARFEFKPDEMVRDLPDLPNDALRQAKALNSNAHPQPAGAPNPNAHHQPAEALTLKACHPERSEAQPSAVEGPHATQPHHRPEQEFPPQTPALSVATTTSATAKAQLAACHPERSEAQPSAVEGPRATRPHHRPEQEFPPQTPPLSATTTSVTAKSALAACHPERSEAQPSAVEGPHATQPYHRLGEEFPPQTPPLSATTSSANPKSALAMNTERSEEPAARATHPAYSEHELQTMRQREARRARPLTNQQAETNRALHELECSLQGAQRGNFKDLQTVLEAGGLLDEDGHL